VLDTIKLRITESPINDISGGNFDLRPTYVLEKALFKHLKNRKIPPPKHGIIFQHPRISSSPKKVRGKIARTLANKLALAAKADAFSKRRISAELKKEFDGRYAEIMKEYQSGKKK